MSSFLATASTAPDPAIVKNDGWFPDIDLQDMREAMRLDGTVTEPRLKQAIIAAILHVNGELADWKEEQQRAGHDKLDDVPATRIDDESRLLACYRRAVYCSAAADLTERYRDFDATADGSRKADALEPSIDDQRRNAHWAIADIIGRRRLTVELI
jgi:hypothetical protein